MPYVCSVLDLALCFTSVDCVFFLLLQPSFSLNHGQSRRPERVLSERWQVHRFGHLLLGFLNQFLQNLAMTAALGDAFANARTTTGTNENGLRIGFQQALHHGHGRIDIERHVDGRPTKFVVALGRIGSGAHQNVEHFGIGPIRQGVMNGQPFQRVGGHASGAGLPHEQSNHFGIGILATSAVQGETLVGGFRLGQRLGIGSNQGLDHGVGGIVDEGLVQWKNSGRRFAIKETIASGPLTGHIVKGFGELDDFLPVFFENGTAER
mmetsp:Transcript_1189/g.3333  ORF Transcript_1189/g.3333 Transcript_1189/m.3333 type:complete len:265 (-) Transcript_1189:179-973(-)